MRAGAGLMRLSVTKTVLFSAAVAAAFAAAMMPRAAQSNSSQVGSEELAEAAIQLIKSVVRCPTPRIRNELSVEHVQNRFVGDSRMFAIETERNEIGFAAGYPAQTRNVDQWSVRISDLGEVKAGVSPGALAIPFVGFSCKGNNACFGAGMYKMQGRSLDVCDDLAAANIEKAMNVLMTLGLPALSPRSNTAGTLWMHNGSVVKLIADRSSRKFVYEQPRDGLDKFGVATGQLLFEGRLDGDAYVGVAYVFSRSCGPASYPVAGEVSSSRTEVVLRGKAPRRNAACEIVGDRDDILTFTYQKQAN